MIGKLLKSPLSLAAYGVGLVRGAAASVLRAASGSGGPAHAEWIAPPEPVDEEALEGDLPDESERSDEVVLGDHREAADPIPPTEPGEQFATEPSAVSRTSAHGGGGHDEEIDDWYGEQDAPEPPEGVVASLEFGDRNS